MKKVIIVIGLSVCSLAVFAKNYYVDPVNGDDFAAGTTAKTAWRSIEKVNAATFAPGDSILFLRGGVWHKPLHPKGSGKKGAPIVIAGYGHGERPLIAGDGFTGCGVVSLYNQSWWHVTELELTNFSSVPDDRRGVEVKGANGGLLQHIHLKNLLIHHISGIVGNKGTAGVQFVVTDYSQQPTRFDDLLVEGCTIHNIQNQGIVLNSSGYPGDEVWEACKFTNVRIQNRSRHHDGSLYDPDEYSPETVWERSYSHDNAHGLVWFCTAEKDNDIIVRDNLSEDDHGFLIYINYPFTSAHVYRNLFYSGSSVAPYFLRDNIDNLHLFRPASTDKNDPVVGMIAGMPVYRSEVEREKRRCRWNDGGEEDAYLVNLRRIKVEQQEMARRGMPEAAVFGNFFELLRMENDLRRSTPLDKVVWFGPETWHADDFWDYFIANAREELKKLMSLDILSHTEEEVRAYFTEGDSERGVWEKRGYDYARTAVATRLLDKKYEEYFDALAMEATVDALLLWPQFLSGVVAPSSVVVRKDVAFLEPDREERMDLYLPASRPLEAQCPAIVWIHGGGWMGGKKDNSREVNVCTTLAAAGYVCTSIDYRLGAGAWPQNLFDCKAAVRYLRDHANELGIDPERIAVGGGSAGGHLALMVGFTSGKPGFEPDHADEQSSGTVRCVIDFYGATNLVTRQETMPDGTLTGKFKQSNMQVFGDVSDFAEIIKQVSPVTHITPQSPPVMILQGRADTSVDYAQSVELAAKLKKNGVPHELILMDGIGHTFNMQKWGGKKLPIDVQAAVLSFLEKHL